MTSSPVAVVSVQWLCRCGSRHRIWLHPVLERVAILPLFMRDELQQTLSVGVVRELIHGDIYYWGSLMAACIVGSLPIIVLYAFFMDYYVSGLTAGTIK